MALARLIGEQLALNAIYQFALVSTEFNFASGMALDDPGYSRHQALLGAHVAVDDVQDAR